MVHKNVKTVFFFFFFRVKIHLCKHFYPSTNLYNNLYIIRFYYTLLRKNIMRENLHNNQHNNQHNNNIKNNNYNIKIENLY